MLWVNLFRASKLSIEYVDCGLRTGPVTDIYSIFEFLYSSIEDRSNVSAGGQPQETKVSHRLLIVRLRPV